MGEDHISDSSPRRNSKGAEGNLEKCALFIFLSEGRIRHVGTKCSLPRAAVKGLGEQGGAGRSKFLKALVGNQGNLKSRKCRLQQGGRKLKHEPGEYMRGMC